MGTKINYWILSMKTVPFNNWCKLLFINNDNTDFRVVDSRVDYAEQYVIGNVYQVYWCKAKKYFYASKPVDNPINKNGK